MIVSLVVLLLFIPLSVLAQDANVDVNAALEQLKNPDANARARAADEVVSSLCAAIGPEGSPQGLTAKNNLRALVNAVGASQSKEDDSAISAALIKQAASDLPLNARHYALRMLSLVGGEDAVPGLAGLLTVTDVREMARYALVRIPGAAARQALEQAVVREKDPSFKAALINGLAARAEVEAFDTVAAITDPNEAVRMAVLNALGNLGSPAGEPLLAARLDAGSDAEKKVAQDAYLRLADKLAAGGQNELAAKMYRRIYESAGPEHYRCAGLVGLGNVGGAEAVPIMMAALNAPENTVRGVAKQALMYAQSPQVGQALVKLLQDAPAEQKADVVSILGERREKAAVPALGDMAKAGDEALQVAALNALAKIGDPTSVPVILQLATGPDGNVTSAAAAALRRIPGEEATKAIVQALTGADPTGAKRLLGVLGTRQDASVLPALQAAAKHADEGVRIAALDAIGLLGSASGLPTLLEAAQTGSDAVRTAAENALKRFREDAAVQAMVKALEGAPTPTRLTLLRVLGALQRKDLVNTFSAAARDTDESVALAALDALTKLRDESTAPLFLELAEKGSDAIKAAAVRGYLQIAEARQGKEGPAVLPVYYKALELANRDDERRVAIQGIGRIADPSSLPVLRPYLEKGALREVAAAAVVPIAPKLAAAGRKDEAIELLTKAIELCKDRNVVTDAAGRLRELGVVVDLAGKAGFITNWWVVGPVGKRDDLKKADAIDPAQPVDLTRDVQIAGRTQKWKYVPVDDPTGMLDLEKAAARQDNVGAYVYAEVTSDKEQDVIFSLGSDDDFVCWLNGKEVGRFDGNRAYAPDQTKCKAHLKVGTNTILVKVLNGGAQWAIGLRITDPSGAALQLPQRKP